MSNPTCPYCGNDMSMWCNRTLKWYECTACGAVAPADTSEEEALEKALHHASPWHSVKDGLPENGTIYVVHGHNRRGVGCCDLALKTKAGWEFGGISSFEVEHWMPVPDAPEVADDAV